MGKQRSTPIRSVKRAGRDLQLVRFTERAMAIREKLTLRCLLGWLFHFSVFLAAMTAIAPNVTSVSQRHVGAVDNVTRFSFLALLHISFAYLVYCLTRACLGSGKAVYYSAPATIAVALISLIPWYLVANEDVGGRGAADLPGAIVLSRSAWIFQTFVSTFVIVGSLLTVRFSGCRLVDVTLGKPVIESAMLLPRDSS